MKKILKKNKEKTFSPALNKRAVWLTSGVAQFMVLLNGLILTLTVFFVLTYFIQEMSKEEYRNSAERAGKHLIEGITDIEHSMKFVSSLIRLSDIPNRELLSQQIRRNIPGLAQFDQLVWVFETRPGVWQYKNIFQAAHEDIPPSHYTLKPNQKLISRLVKDKFLEDETLQLVTDFPDMGYAQEFNSPRIMARPVAFTQTVQKGNSAKGILIGVSRAVLLLESDWMDQKSLMARLTIRDVGSQDRIYHMDRTQGEEDAEFTQVYDFTVADSGWHIIFEFVKRKNLVFLEKIPYLTLAFGLILTIIGTLFVRNNHKQSQKVALMNKTLEQKNFELESEVSERERLNKVLVKSEKDYRAIIDSVSDSIFEISTDGNILFLSAAWVKTTGFDNERTLGNDLFLMFHPEDQKRQRHDFELFVKGQKQAYRAFTRIRTSDGTFRAVELSMSMIRQDENKQLRVVGTLNDVEERRRAERALAEAEKKYRTIVENAAGGLYQLTPEGLYLSANPAMARILGYESVEEMLRLVKTANGSVYPDIDAREAFLMGLIKAGQIFGYETQVIKKDKSAIWVRENIRVVKDEQGNILYFEGSMEDITNAKVAELALRKAKVESDMANRAKTEFIANMSHELRTPLNAIIGFSEIMKNQVLGPLGQDMYVEYADDIFTSGKGLLKIINDILDISKIEAGDKELKESEFSLAEAHESCNDLFASKASEKQISIIDKVASLPRILGEERAIKQALTNVYSNAIKFTDVGGRVTVFSNYDTDGAFRLSISDTGIGLTKDEIEKALSPFGQGDNALDRSGSGIGLGLTLCQSIMKLHRGRLEILSEKGIGTTVTLVFPHERVFRPEDDEQEGVRDMPESLKKDSGSIGLVIDPEQDDQA